MLRQEGRQLRGRIIRSAWVILLTVCAFAALKTLAPGRVSHGQGSESLQIGNVQANATTVGRFDKFELTFDITGTVASSLDWPYDPDPPPGIPAGVGIIVDGLFSPDNWTTVYTQPAFLYQHYTYAVRNDYDHLYPDDSPTWKIHFSAPTVGVWSYRIRATDASAQSFILPVGILFSPSNRLIIRAFCTSAKPTHATLSLRMACLLSALATRTPIISMLLWPTLTVALGM
jgi:hypothetical protein